MSNTDPSLTDPAAVLKIDEHKSSESAKSLGTSLCAAGGAGTLALNGAGAAVGSIPLVATAITTAVVGIVECISNNSVKKAEIAATADVRKYYLDKVAENIKENNRHKEAMAKLKKDIKCGEKGCGASFESSEDLTEHVKNQHRGFICFHEGCGASFGSSEALSTHFRTAHCGPMIPCSNCKAFFSNPKDLCDHVLQAHARNSNNSK